MEKLIRRFWFIRLEGAFLLTLFLAFWGQISARDNDAGSNKKPEIVFSGFIKYEVFYDSRQTVNSREGLVVMYPANVFRDEEGNDVNSNPHLNMLCVHSRIRCGIKGPELLGARTEGLVEADFFGNENSNFSDLNGLRLFNAYMKFDWGRSKLLAGQFWHPMSVPGFFPVVVSYNTGAPFHPMSRNPQIRFEQTAGIMKFIGCLFSQRDFTGTGPDGPGSQYLRNAGVPNVHFQVQCGRDSSGLVAGAGIDYKKIVPELFTVNDEAKVYKTKNSLSGVSLVGFLSAKTKPLSVKVEGIYAQNAHDMLMIGGYASKRVSNIETGEREFANLNTGSVWMDLHTNGTKYLFGLFGGISKNLGSSGNIEGPFYVRGQDIKSVYRISPRIVYTTGPLGISLEGECTTANYGTINGDGKGGVTDAKPVTNFRSLLSLKYNF